MENFQTSAFFTNASFNQLSGSQLSNWEALESKKHVAKSNNVEISCSNAEKIVSVKKRGFKLFNWKPSRFLKLHGVV